MLAASYARMSLPYSPTSPQLDARIAGAVASVVTSTGAAVVAAEGTRGGPGVRDFCCCELPVGSRLGMGGVARVQIVEVDDETDGSPRRGQRREEREKRLRGRGSSGDVALVGADAADRSGATRSETDPRRRSRALLGCCDQLPDGDDDVCGRVSDDLERGGLEMSTTEGCANERELDPCCRRWCWVSPRE